jgi:hypothetical protein
MSASVFGPFRERLVDDSAGGGHILLAWAGAERVVEGRAIARLALLVLAMIGALLGISVAAPAPARVFVAPNGETFRESELLGGAPLRGNTPADLDAARAVAQRLVGLRFVIDSASLNPQLDTLGHLATPAGRRALDQSLPRAALAAMILADAGMQVVREYGVGAVAVGEAPGVVRITIPLTGVLWSRHVPFDGPASGIPLGGIVSLRLHRQGSAWMLDSLSGDIIDSRVARAWIAHALHERVLPKVIIGGQAIPADSSLAVGWRRGLLYAENY